MFLQEYIIDIAIFPVTIIFLILSIGIFIDKVIRLKKYSGRQRLKTTSGLFILFIMLTVIQICIGVSNLEIKYTCINDISPTIMTLSLALMSYRYNFIVDKGLFINGNIILWQDIKAWNWNKDEKDTIIIEYSKDSNDIIKNLTFGVKDRQAKEIESLLTSKNNSKINFVKENKTNMRSIIAWSICGLLITGVVVNTYIKIAPKSIESFLGDILNNDKYIAINLVEKKYKNNNLQEDNMRIEEVQNQLMNNMSTLKVRKLDFEVNPNQFNKDTLELYFVDEANNITTIKVYQDLRTLRITQGEKVEHYWVEGVNITKKFLLHNPKQSNLSCY